MENRKPVLVIEIEEPTTEVLRRADSTARRSFGKDYHVLVISSSTTKVYGVCVDNMSKVDFEEFKKKVLKTIENGK